MKVIEFETRVKSRSTVLHLVPIGDIHWGTINCDEDKLIETIKWVKEKPDTYTILMGDMAEYINLNDPRFDPSTLHPTCRDHLDNLASFQTEAIIRMFWPIRHRIMGILEGNHEDVIRRKYHFNPTDVMAERLGVPNLTYNAFIRWHIHRTPKGRQQTNTLVIYASHGFGAGRYAGGKVNNLLNLARGFEADIYLVGHVHEKIGKDADRLYVTHQGDPHVVARKKIFAITGCFLKVYEENSRNYGERHMYDPTPTGVVKIRIEPFRSSRIGGVTHEQPPHLHISE